MNPKYEYIDFVATKQDAKIYIYAYASNTTFNISTKSLLIVIGIFFFKLSFILVYLMAYKLVVIKGIISFEIKTKIYEGRGKIRTYFKHLKVRSEHISSI